MGFIVQQIVTVIFDQQTKMCYPIRTSDVDILLTSLYLLT